MMKMFLFLLPVALLAQTAQTQAPPAQVAPAQVAPGALADPVVLVVGDEKMTKSQYEKFVAALPQQLRTEAAGPNKRKVIEQISEIKMLAQEARRRGLDQTPEVKMLVSFQTENVLASATYQELAKNVKTDDASLHAYYDKHKGEYEQVKARHILIRTPGSRVPVRQGQKELSDAEALAKAQDISKKLKGGADFATLAKSDSDDSGTAANGGDLGAFGRNQMIPEFEEVAFKMPPGQISDPVKTQFGYHVIKVEDHSTKKFEDVKPDIEKAIGPEATRQAFNELKKKINIVIDDAYFGK